MSKTMMRERIPRASESRREMHNIELPRHKGLYHWDAVIDPEHWLMKTVDDLSSHCDMEEVLSRLPRQKVLHIWKVLGPWCSATEDLLGPEETGIKEKFVTLANRWHDETDYLSSPTQITSNEAYLKIISLGKSVIPLILRDLQKRGGDWYTALRALTDNDPVAAEDRGNTKGMKESWVSWGRDRGYIK